VSAALRRAAGEALGCLCNAEGDAFTATLVRNITELVWRSEEENRAEMGKRKRKRRKRGDKKEQVEGEYNKD
jgi:hypothetical protein